MGKKNFLKEIGSKSIVEQIVDNITNAIIDGELKPGDKIPTENELAVSMNVGRNSVREAIKILVAYGVLIIKRSEGTFVRREFNKEMLYPVLYGIILQEDSANQIVELRKIIDVGALQLAIDKMDNAAMLDAEKAFCELEKSVQKANLTARDIFDADVQFHETLADISQNKLLEGICSYVDKITKTSRLKAIQRFLRENALEGFLSKHREILRILREKKGDEINEVVNRHYEYWEEI